MIKTRTVVWDIPSLSSTAVTITTGTHRMITIRSKPSADRTVLNMKLNPSSPHETGTYPFPEKEQALVSAVGAKAADVASNQHAKKIYKEKPV